MVKLNKNRSENFLAFVSTRARSGSRPKCGISGTAQSWFKSYLEDRSQKVQLHGSSSASSILILRFGVPQGSVLGPILFTIYTIPLGGICRHHI